MFATAVLVHRYDSVPLMSGIMLILLIVMRALPCVAVLPLLLGLLLLMMVLLRLR